MANPRIHGCIWFVRFLNKENIIVVNSTRRRFESVDPLMFDTIGLILVPGPVLCFDEFVEFWHVIVRGSEVFLHKLVEN